MKASHSSMPRSLVHAATAPIGAVSQRALAVGVIAAGMLHLGGILANFGLNTFLARSLPSDQFGLFVLLSNQALLMATCAGAGLPLAIIRFYPQHLADGDETAAAHVATVFWKKSIRNGFVVAMGTAFILTVALSLNSVPQSPLAWCLAAGLTGVLVVASFQLELARSTGLMTLSYLPMRIAWPLATILVVQAAIIVSGETDVVIVLTAAIFCLLTATSWQAIAIRKHISTGQATSPSKASPSEDSEWRTVARPLWIMAIGSSLLTTADIMVVGYCLSEIDAGYFFAAKRFAALAVICQFAINARVAPALSALVHSKIRQRHALQKTLRNSAVASFVLAVPMVIGLVCFGAQALTAFGPEYAAAAQVLGWLACGQLINAAGGAVGSLMNVSGLQKSNATIVILTAAGQVLGCFLLIPWMGTVGAGVAMVIAALVRNIVLGILVWKELRVDPTIFSVLTRLSHATT